MNENILITVQLEPELHAWLASMVTPSRSLSDLINEAVRRSRQEGQLDLEVFAERQFEPTLPYEAIFVPSNGKQA